QYIKLFKIRIGYENRIFLNSLTARRDILNKQLTTASSHSPLPVVSDLLSGGKYFVFTSYTPKWRKLWAIVYKLLTPKAS
ncbi:hypothetical protein COCVIDRAFT_116109, partial [Bipolaris victoriae FI3]